MMLAFNATIIEGSRPVIEAIGKLYWLGVSFLLGAAFGAASTNLVMATIGLKEISYHAHRHVLIYFQMSTICEADLRPFSEMILLYEFATLVVGCTICGDISPLQHTQVAPFKRAMYFV